MKIIGRISQAREADPSGDGGAVAVIVAVCAFLFMGLAAISVDIARIYVEAERVQKAADAAALAGVTYMPQDLASARTAAAAVASRNGYTHGGDVVVSAEPGGKPSQLSVSVTAAVDNGFAGVFGIESSTVTREAVADFQGAIPMGSPCNTFGNEPAGTNILGPVGSSLPFPGFPNCSSNPMFWANIQGPQTDKVQGDQYMTRRCGTGGTDGCSGSTNADFQPQGYFFVVRVTDPVATGPITIQLYDPAFIVTGPDCRDLPSYSTLRDNMNGYTTADGRTRYRGTNNAFCTGDYWPGGTDTYPPGTTAAHTSFALRAPADSLVPASAPVIPQCVAQYKGRSSAPSYTDLRATNEMTRVFHQWVPLCTITNPVKGDYYLQVRTNVALPAMSSSQYIAGAGGTIPADADVTRQAGDDTSVRGGGSNAFGIRALSSDGAKVSVSGYERMPMYANATDQTSTFNLIKAMPGSAGKTIEFSFYDAADGAPSGGTVKVSRPADATGSITSTTSLQGCTGKGVVTGNLTNCTATVRPSTNNGRVQTIYIPVPSDYSCNYSSLGGCWFSVTVSFPGSSVTDITTWTAAVLGDPVRLIR